ncbi:hypothetical protein XM47_12775 [Catenovulum maritimum]|uniref:Uncharacterized protein n=1 Tax=Catenovulum maritimum TaxID=1513271 RepID=A0A0J8GVM8_9ALTE|nr:hypothetical protein XM47_12775 [Catenovulum maritimum]
MLAGAKTSNTQTPTQQHQTTNQHKNSRRAACARENQPATPKHQRSQLQNNQPPNIPCLIMSNGSSRA